MENASKALIIAGAILLSILLISLGIMVYNQAKNTLTGVNLDKQQIESFNSSWISYEDRAIKASEIRSMVQSVIVNNSAEAKNGTNQYITVVSAASETDAKTGSSIASVQPKVTIEKLPTTTTYKVKLGYDTATGLVCDIVVYPTTAFSNATDFSIKCDNRPAVT